MTRLEQPATASPWSLIGHDWAVEHLKAQIVRGEVRQVRRGGELLQLLQVVDVRLG